MTSDASTSVPAATPSSAPSATPSAAAVRGRRPRQPGQEAAGHYAGIVSRSASFVLDAVFFTIGSLGTIFVIDAVWALLKGDTFTMDTTSLLPETVFLVGSYVYFAGAWWIFGRTLGEAIFGLRVVRGDGRRVKFLRATVRFIFTTLGVGFFGLGFLWILVDRRRRTWGDIVARTVVIYDLGDDVLGHDGVSLVAE
jgi:uncharacterized RDD family membrane protein YckC